MLKSLKESIIVLMKKPVFWLVIIVILGIVIRVSNLPKAPFEQDLKFFQDWTIVSLQNGLTNIYNHNEGRLPVDYPPIYLYVLTVLGYISRDILHISIDSSKYEYFIKVLNIFIDLGVSAFLFAIVRRLSSVKYAVISVFAYFLNPYVIFVSSIWGQIDNIISFFTLASIYLYISNKFKDLSFTSIALGILTKFQVVIVSPFIFLHYLFNNTFKGLLKSVVIAAIVGVLVVSPFLLTGNIGKVIEIYTSSTGRYPAISMNAFNIWWVFSNPRELFAVNSDTPLRDLSLFPIYQKGEFTKGEVLSSKNLAYFLFFLVFIILCLNVFVNKDLDSLFLSMSTGVVAFFTLNVQMHERYLYPFFAIAAIYFFKKPLYLVSFIFLSILGWFNLMFVFPPNNVIIDIRNRLYPDFTYFIAVCTVVIFILLLSHVIKNIYTGIVTRRGQRV
ncbi:MAG: hypothetical protein WCO33_03325 [bacterium]